MQGCAFLALVDFAAHLWVQVAQKPQMCQILKCSYYENYCIDHNQILQSDRDPQILTVGGPNVPPDKPIDRFWHNLACWCASTLWTPIANKILRFQKSKMAATDILKIRKIAISPQRNDRFWQNLIQWCIRALYIPLSLIHIWRCRRSYACRSRWSPYH